MKETDMRLLIMVLAMSFACIVILRQSHRHVGHEDSASFRLEDNAEENCNDFLVDRMKHGYQSSILKRLQWSEKNWHDAVILRHEYMATKSNLNEFKPWGSIGDGGKWLCGFELLEESKTTKAPCVVYSFGVNRESSFEAETLEKTNCDVFAYDMTVRRMGQQISGGGAKLRFKSVGLGVNNTHNLRTLATLMAENGHVWIDVLKIDIEGAEFATLESWFDSYNVPPFGQLQLEIHSLRLSFPDFYNWWERLESKGLRAFSSEINFYPCISPKGYRPDLMEYSFINVHISNTLVPSGFRPKI
ncbi:unnamed protein product [Orchesella dallaii]|uniref:Methyltransferase domain-containing protein n=1 Tax=Orchesella dallaii TaxID=48710 RepID=A0ABP1R4M5_9HEXA